MGGIGKTTLADCLYRRMRRHFDGSCFLTNIRENSSRNGLESLLQKLFSTLLNDREIEIGAPGNAHERFGRRLKTKRLLIVLDDVSDEKQIRYLMGHSKWCQGGSRIIITTRDSKLIQGRKYVLPKLNDREALKLFSMKAFNKSCPSAEFESLANMVLDYAKGNPLALKMLGSDLYNRDALYWEDKLDKLTSRSHKYIYEVLETSYEELTTEQKNVFLDIACFFRSEKVDYVKSLLNNHGVDVSRVIDDLLDKCLITLSGNRIEMHDMLQTMGKEISLYQSHIRLLDSDAICDRLTNGIGTGNIRGIFLDTSKLGAMRLRAKAFKGMYNLKYLKIYDSRCSRGCESEVKLHFREGLDFLPNGLKYLHWHGYPLQSIPDIDLKNLVDLKLPHSKLEEIWDGDKNCRKLKHLSSDLHKLKCLQELILSGCSQLEVFPEIEEDMESLEILLLDDTAISEMPNMMHLSNIKTFSLCGTDSQLSVSMFFSPPPLVCSRLTDLYLSSCSLYELPEDIGGLSFLQYLCLSGNGIEYLPQSFNQLHNLKWFDLKYCKMLKTLPTLPESLQYLDAHECESLESLANPLTPLTVGERINSMFIFSNCYKLNQDTQETLVGHGRIKSQLMANASVKRYYLGFIPEPLVGICFPASEIPNWFCYQRLGRSLEITLPPHWCDSSFVGLAFSVVISFTDYEDSAKRFSVKCSGKFENQDSSSTVFDFTLAGWNEPCKTLSHEPRKLTSDHVFMGYNSFFHVEQLHEESNSCCHTKASFEFYATDNETKKKLETCKVIKCGMSLVYVPDDEDGMLLKKTNVAQLSSQTEQSCSNGLDDVRLKRGRCNFGGGGGGGDEESECKKTKEDKILVL
ncbi:hypothetical protein HID58_018032 [Brassica napus]|uniref:ADP-ribosyl cyclase/cyclic ADP-ribose hydrolase n=1 Tax=Brassica napus TaxID=3708 RepID=A0ABQ8DBJ3_BRANA|nr:hypothetical protein HID58_018032 [Brassica napus]